jgi:cystathionine beta-lyase
MSQVLQQSLDESEVFELVCDYLRTRRFYRAEQALLQEHRELARTTAQEQKLTHSQEGGDNVLDQHHSNQREIPALSKQRKSSKLESLLERSYVTNFVSGNSDEGGSYMTKRKRRRTHLDGNDINTHTGNADDDGDDDEDEYGLSTQLVSFDACRDDPHGSATMPIYQTSTFAQKSATDFGAYDYTRSGNPTRAALERQMAELEKGHRAFAFTSGMAALSAISRLAKAGDHIVLSDDSYGGTYRLLSKITAKAGVHVTYVDLSGAQGAKNLEHVCTRHQQSCTFSSSTFSSSSTASSSSASSSSSSSSTS